MNLLVMAILAANPLLPQAFQDSGDVNELRFHRVHLTNGNFIDGQLIKDSPNVVLLRIKTGEMSIRRDQIDRVEFIKMRDRWQPPDRFSTPVKPKDPLVKDPADPTKDPKNPLIENTPAEIKKRVDMMVFKLRSMPGDEKSFNVSELAALGDEGALYLASRLGDMDVKLHPAFSSALVNLKNMKVVPVIAEFLNHKSAPVRAVAVAVIGMILPSSESSRYLRPMLGDSDASVRGTVLGMINTVNEPEWIDPLSDLCADPQREVRTLAMGMATKLAIKHERQDKLLRRLSGNLRDSNDGVRADNAAGIGGLGKSDAWVHLTPVLTDPEPKVRASAAQALVQIAPADAGPDIVAAIIQERERWVRVPLAQCALKLKLQKAIEPLINWLSDPEEDIRNLAEATLRNLTGQAHGLDRAKWAEWYEKTNK